MKHSVLMLGCGNMGFAMLDAWVRGASGDFDFCVIEPNIQSHGKIAALGVQVVASAEALANHPAFDLVFLAVKPQIMAEALEGLNKTVQGNTYISIAAGLSTAFFKAHLPENAHVIRVMPNTPAAIGAGAMAVYAPTSVPDATLQSTQSLLAHNGMVRPLQNEADMDAITAISGSGPAYIFHMAECLEQAALALGLEADLARDFARQTVYGAGALLHDSALTSAALREAVTSPNGTTQAGLSKLMEDGALEKLVLKTAKAAENRSKELEIALNKS